MLKKIALVSAWFLLAPATLISSLFFANQVNNSTTPSNTASENLVQNLSFGNVQGEVLGEKISDMRPYFVANLLKNTILESYAELMVEVADKYAIDYRLIPAIAMKESGGGNKTPVGSFNAWGFENGKTQFASWEQAIDIVGKTLQTRYIAKGLTTPEEIMAVYAPPQLLTGGKWAKDIHYFFSKMESL